MLKIDVEEIGNVVIVSLIGELSFNYVEEFESLFRKYVNSEFKVITLDLKQVPYLDSFGISRLIKISRVITGGGGEFVLMDMNESIFQIFKIATFDKVFKIMTREDFFLTYLQSERTADHNYTEILNKGKILCRVPKEVKITHMEFVDDSGTTLVFLEDE